MIDVICLGSVTLDLFFKDPSLTIQKDRFALALGGKYVVNDFSDGMGGGGANIAIGLARAGCKSALWSQMGKGGLSLYIEEKLTHEGVDLSLLDLRTGFANLSAILLSPRGERTILTHRSETAEITLTQPVRDALKATKMLFIGNMPEVSLGMRHDAMKIVKKLQGKVALNFGVKDCRRGLRELSPLFQDADIIFMNRYELGDTLGMPGRELLPMEINYHHSMHLPEHTILVITDGEFGSYAHTSTKITHINAVEVPRVTDTTGAGDAFTSGFLAGIVLGKPLSVCMHAGATNSASVIRHVTAQRGLLSYHELFENAS